MAFNISFPMENGDVQTSQLGVGEVLFVLGPNGAGKSSLMLHFAANNSGNSRRISAHRQTWMATDALDMTPASKLQTEKHIRSTDSSQQSRYRDDYAAQRASITIYDLIDAENVRAREIAAFVDSGDIKSAKKAAKKDAPITVINDLLLRSSIPITISIRKNERLVASKNGGPEYSAAELSDGERNAVLIAGNVLTVPGGTLLIIDEPERHLHRSIISPLLSQLFTRRRDCGFVISTHDQNLPLAMPESRSLLLRSCKFTGQSVTSWEADELPQDAPIDDKLKRDLLGARRNIVFIEGTDSSLDRALYGLIFPMASVIPKGSFRSVRRAVSGVREGEPFHWLRAFGIVDGDGYEARNGQASSENGVYTLPFYAVESIYYHPWIIKRIAQRKADVTGEAPSNLTTNALSVGVDAISGETDRLSRVASKRQVRKEVYDKMPNDDELLSGDPVTVENNATAILATRKRELDDAVARGDWEALVTKCPVRESAALAQVSGALGFRKRREYEKAVRHLLNEDDEAMGFVRGLFGDLFERLDGSRAP